MEDTIISHKLDLPNGGEAVLFGVFDGHGGKDVARFCQKHFFEMFIATTEYELEEFEKALKVTFMNLDKKI